MLEIKQKQKFSFLGISIALFLFFPLQTVFASEITPNKVIELVNDVRLSNKMGVLVKDEKLMQVAQMKLDDMVEKKYFAHTSPEGKTPWMWFDKAGYNYEYAGENLAIHFTQAEDQQQAWMNSITHRKNILNPKYFEIGVAVWKGNFEGRDTIITVQEFGRREGEVSSTESISASAQKNVSVQETESLSEKSGIPTGPALSTKITGNQKGSIAARAYEEVLLLFWVVMLVQAIVLSIIIFHVPKKAKQNIPVHKKKEDREYVIPVKVFSKKIARL